MEQIEESGVSLPPQLLADVKRQVRGGLGRVVISEIEILSAGTNMTVNLV